MFSDSVAASSVEEWDMKLIAVLFLVGALMPAFVLASDPAFAASGERNSQLINRHDIYALRELEHYRIYELDSHFKPLNDGTFLLGSGGTVNPETNDAIPIPTRQSHPMQLAAGVDHLIIITCDEDCIDTDLRVYDAAGDLVVEDVGEPTSDTRIIVSLARIVPPMVQEYRFEVEISCRDGSRGGCSYAVGVNTE